MDIVVAIIGLALVVIVAAYIVQPLVVKSRVVASKESPREKLLAERDALYSTIRDLDMDFQTGKLLEVDYRSLREGHVAQGIEILKQLDAMEALPDRRPSQVQQPAADDPIEAAIQGRRKGAARPAEDPIEAAIRARRQSARPSPQSADRERACPGCGRPADPTDKFCAGCGTPLTVEAIR